MHPETPAEPSPFPAVEVGMTEVDRSGSPAGTVTAVQPPGTDVRPDVVTGVAERLMAVGYVRVDGTGEGVLAEPLETVAKAHPELSLGSYPFFGPAGYGSNLVIRGRDEAEVEATVTELVAALAALGIPNITADQPGQPSGVAAD